MRSLFCAGIFLLASAGVALPGDVSGRGPNGGRLADAPGMHIEFVSKGTEILVATYDHDNKPISSAGMKGRVTIQEGKQTRSADLTVEAPNRLTGKLEAPLADNARIIVSITPKDGKPVQARYRAR